MDRANSIIFMNKQIFAGLENGLDLVYDYVRLFLARIIRYKRNRVLQFLTSQRSSSVDGPDETVERELFLIFWLVIDLLDYPSVGFVEALRKTV